MKIAFFLSDYPVTSETFVLRQIRGMLERGHDVTVITGRTTPEAPDPLAGRVRVCVIRAASSAREYVSLAFKAAFRTSQIRVALRALRCGLRGSFIDILNRAGDPLGTFDAVVAHFGPAGVRAMWLREAGLLKGPIATVFHGFDMTDRALVAHYLPHYRELFKKTEIALPISSLWQQRLTQWGAETQKVRVVRMGVDMPPLGSTSFDRPLAQPLRILSVARLVDKKGLRYAIEGIAQAGIDAEYRIIGYGPMEAELRALASAKNLPVQFLGSKNHAEVLKELQKSDAFLLPSVTAANGDMEGVPVSIMEAMAHGVFVLSTVHSGIPELISSEIEGILVPERDPSAIAQALRRLLSELDVPAIREAAFKKIASQFDNAHLDRELELVLSELRPQ